MKKLLTIIAALFCTVYLWGQSSVSDMESFKSEILGKDVSYSVYLPESYNTSTRSYPVLYLLHGYGNDHHGWVEYGEVKYIADKAISENKATEMIIVMPNAWDSWYVNDHKGNVKYEDMFINELIPHIENKYRARADKKHRAISGLSMGGYGSLLYALKHPDMFVAAAALSPAVFTDEEIMIKGSWYEGLFERLFGKGISDYYNQNSILNIIKNRENGNLEVKIFIDCGDNDFLYKGNTALHAALRDKGIGHEFNMRSGEHNWIYWRGSLPKVLDFVSKGFRY